MKIEQGASRRGMVRVCSWLVAAWIPMIASAFNATLEWDANTETDLAGYKTYYGPGSRTYTNIVDVGNVTSNRLFALTPGATYFFAVTAYNTSGDESDFSDEIAYTVPSSGNAPPTLDPISDVVVDEDAPVQSILLSGITTGATNESDTLRLTAISDNPAVIPNPSVIYDGAGSTGTLSFTPATNANGVATIEVIVDDGQNQNSVVTRHFAVSVGAVNDPPALDSLPDLMVAADGNARFVSLTGIHSGATNEDQALTVTATSSDPGRVPNPTADYNSPDTSGTLAFTPVAGGGTATITVTVDDGAASNNITTRSFEVAVQGMDQAPTISAIPDQTVIKNRSSETIPFTIGDGETPATNLVLSASTSNTNIISTNGITFGGSGSNRTGILTAQKGRLGTALVTIHVNDGLLQASTTFQFTIANLAKTLSETAILSATAIPLEGIAIQWSSAAGGVYRVVFKEQLSDSTWHDLSPDIYADGAVTTWTDASAPSHRSRYYSVVMIQPETVIGIQ